MFEAGDQSRDLGKTKNRARGVVRVEPRPRIPPEGGGGVARVEFLANKWGAYGFHTSGKEKIRRNSVKLKMVAYNCHPQI